ncbi:MAG TPA: hypothetical protein VMZ51_00060 [Acidimicrobiales bacterium]|nr:hypothetical protein [Acidimicrobiales bacterium]
MSDPALTSKVVNRAIGLVSAGSTFDAVMDDTLGIADAACPSPIWSTIASVDRNRDVRALGKWMLDKLMEHPRPARLTGLWFGLYEVGPAGEQYPMGAEAVLKLSGGRGFPHDPDWLFKQDWYPGGYAPTPGLGSLLGIAASSQDHFGLVSYAFVLTYSLGLVAAALDATDPSQVLQGADQVGIAVGFHDGDIAQLGVLSDSGLDRSTLGWA